jgi:hypothetical protein
MGEDLLTMVVASSAGAGTAMLVFARAGVGRLVRRLRGR